MATITANETQKQQPENLIECAICLDYFDDPRILPCSHTFCLRCIQKTAASNGGRFECPLRDGAKIEQDHINSLPINRVLPGIVDFIRNIMDNTSQNDEKGMFISCEVLLEIWIDRTKILLVL